MWTPESLAAPWPLGPCERRLIRNSKTAWGSVSRGLHWAAAAFVFVLLLHGWWMVQFAARADRFGHYTWHASVGYFFLLVMILRLAWRWANAVPEPSSGARAWERWAASLGHWGLYALIFAGSVSGWALAGTFRRPLDTTLFGSLRVPGIVTDRSLHEQLESAHTALAWALAILTLVHVLAAFYHLIFRNDGVMQRMLPGAGERKN